VQVQPSLAAFVGFSPSYNSTDCTTYRGSCKFGERVKRFLIINRETSCNQGPLGHNILPSDSVISRCRSTPPAANRTKPQGARKGDARNHPRVLPPIDHDASHQKSG
jgi:hypothetical protein